MGAALPAPRFDGNAALVPRQQHQPADAGVLGQFGELADGVDRTGDGQVRVVGDVDLVDARQRGRPGLRVVPVERDVGRA